MDAHRTSPLLRTPTDPAEKNPGWGHEKPIDPRAEPVLEQMVMHRAAKLSGAMVIMEYLRRRIALLQLHSWTAWEYTSMKDMMKLHVGSLKPEVLDGALVILLGNPAEDPPEDALPLYHYQEMVELPWRCPFSTGGAHARGPRRAHEKTPLR